MPSSGRFGRLPRAAPDISGAIVAMVREYQAQRERNIVDAWKSGGKFEGRKATDDMLLAFFAERLKGLDPEDPTYDEAKNTQSQYRFAVKNSRQELKYAQGKVNDGAMAAFYRREASAHPRNSEIWRQLMTLAAQYHDRAAAGGGGGGGRGGGRGGRRGSTVADRNARIETPRNSELAWSTMSDVLVDLARRRGIVNSGQSLETATETTGEGFGDLQVWQGDFNAMQDLVNEFATSPQFDADRKALTAYIRKYGDPKFDGNFTLQGILGMRGAAKGGILHRLKDAQQNGTKTQVKALTKSLTILTKAGSALTVLDPMATYEEARDNWEQVWTDPKASPLEKWQATYDYRTQVGEVYSQMDAMAAGLGGSDGGWSSVHAGRLLSEWRALGGDDTDVGPTLWEESRGHVVGLSGSKENSDAYTTAQDVNKYWQQLQRLATDPTNYVIARVDSAGQPTLGPDFELAVVSRDVISASGLPIAYIGGGSDSVDIPTEDGGTTKVDMTGALEVVYGKTIVTKPTGGVGPDGRPTRQDFSPIAGTREDIGAVFDYDDGTRVYQIMDSSGVKRFTTVPPWAESLNVTERQDAKGNIVISWVADPGTAVKTYNPIQVIDPIYTDPNLVNKMHETVFKSSYLAHYVASTERNAAGGVMRDTSGGPNDKTTRAALLAESGGDPDVFNALYAEVTERNRSIAERHAREWEVRDRLPGADEALDLATQDERQQFRLDRIDASTFNGRALQLLTSTGDPHAIPGYEALKDRPGADLAAYVKSLTGKAISEVTKQQSPDAEDAFRVSQGRVTPPGSTIGITGYKDDGRPIYGPVALPTGGTRDEQTYRAVPLPPPPAPKPPAPKPPTAPAPAPAPTTNTAHYDREERNATPVYKPPPIVDQSTIDYRNK